MGDVILFVDELKSNYAIAKCRICHEEEFESLKSLEAPCSCSGTVKFAHRDCIQRWCNEKGNTTCEICLQEYTPGYTTPSKKSPLIEASVTVRDSLQVPRREYEPQTPSSDGVTDETDEYPECTSSVDSTAACCRSLVLTFTILLLLRHLYIVLTEGDDCPFPILLVFILRASGIILPMYILIRTITFIHQSIRIRRRQRVHISNNVSDSEEDE
jgi:hypothetical protein